MFNKLVDKISKLVSTPYAFIVATLLIIIWLLLGPVFNWSELHPLFVNTFTTVISFLLLFILQHAQSKDTKALHLKIDELIKAIDKADNKLRGIEKLSEAEIEQLKNNT